MAAQLTLKQRLRRGMVRLRYLGWARYCPLCSSPLRLFFPHGVVPRPNAVCPVCHSRDRHRLAWLYLKQVLAEPPFPKDFLHLAPEPQLARRLAALPKLHYRAGGLGPPPLEWMDITQLPLPAGSQDFIYCSHVLNMLPSDRVAMLELRRVLRPSGCALLQVPVQRDAHTVELAASASEAERLAAFGDPGMYRRYGADLRLRLKAAGFTVDVLPFYQTIPERRRLRLGLINEDLYLCRPR
jgi:SAM-dependent methyltransferase